ncbi:MAG: hypothetical protein ACRD2L_25385 [Terriglobia bacterium]
MTGPDEHEFEYCCDLVRSGGDENVPEDHVLSYLELQLKSAPEELKAAYEELIVDWIGG